MAELKRVVLTGPESTGKSAASAYLARQFNTLWSPEYAREYLQALKRPYECHDLYQIALGQQSLINHYAQLCQSVLFCDTDLLTIIIWSRFKYQRLDPAIENLFLEQKADFYLLCHIDLPWQYDPLREHPTRRQELLDQYVTALNHYQLPYALVEGTGQNRFNSALGAAKHALKSQ